MVSPVDSLQFAPDPHSVDAIRYLIKRSVTLFGMHRFVIDNGPLQDATKLEAFTGHRDIGPYTLERAAQDALDEGVVRQPVQRLNAIILACFPGLTEHLVQTSDDGLETYLWNLIAALARTTDPELAPEEQRREAALRPSSREGFPNDQRTLLMYDLTQAVIYVESVFLEQTLYVDPDNPEHIIGMTLYLSARDLVDKLAGLDPLYRLEADLAEVGPFRPYEAEPGTSEVSRLRDRVAEYLTQYITRTRPDLARIDAQRQDLNL